LGQLQALVGLQTHYGRLRAKAIGFEAAITIEAGVKAVTKWYSENRNETGKRYDIFDGAL